MAIPPCPACTRNEAIYLGERSRFSYYLCPCGHGWGVHKDKPEVIYNVTPLPTKPDASSVE